MGKCAVIIPVTLISTFLILFNVLITVFGVLRATEADVVSDTALWIKYVLYIVPATLSIVTLIAYLVLHKKTEAKFTTAVVLIAVSVILAIFCVLSIVGTALIEYDWTTERVEMRIEEENATQCCFNYVNTKKLFNSVETNYIYGDCPLIDDEIVSVVNGTCVEEDETTKCEIDMKKNKDVNQFICKENIQGDYAFLIFMLILEFITVIYCVVIALVILLKYKNEILLMFLKNTAPGLLN